jgi:hypothetical protein
MFQRRQLAQWRIVFHGRSLRRLQHLAHGKAHAQARQ